MSKVFISRQDGSVSWGFRLQGGLEYNEPLTVTNIVPNSPADGKLDPGDMLLEIAGNNITNMSHRDALELIQRCSNALFLTVHKVGYSYPPGGAAPRPAPITPIWKPAGQQQQPQQPSYHQQDFQQQPPYYQQNFQQQQPQPSYYQQNLQQQQQPYYHQHDFQQQQQQQYGYGQPPAPMFNVAPPAPAPPPPPPPPPMPATNIPPPPIFDADLIANAAAALKSRPPGIETHTSFEQTTDISNIPAALAKSLGRPGGPKPFTYTPGGLDLSKIRESARVRRHREYISNSEEPNETQESEINMSRRMNVPSEQMNQHHYVPQNPNQSFINPRQQQVAPAKKTIQHDADVVTQSRSFQMLQGWISDSEKTVPTAVPPPSQPTTTTTPIPNKSAVARAVFDEQMGNNSRHGSSSSTTAPPSRSFRYLQEQYNNSNGDNNGTVTTTTTTVEETIIPGEGIGLRRGSDGHMPSRSFKYIQDQCDAQKRPINRAQGINNRDDLVEIYNKPPANLREREPEAPRYTGATVPSRSFRFLQMMTQNDQQNDSKPIAGYNKPQQLMNKYDEQNLSLNTNQINTHPSRSFKYLQEMTAEQPTVTTMTTVTRTERRVSATNNGQPIKMNIEIQQSQPFIQVNTTSSSNQESMIDNLAAEIAATDF